MAAGRIMPEGAGEGAAGLLLAVLSPTKAGRTLRTIRGAGREELTQAISTSSRSCLHRSMVLGSLSSMAASKIQAICAAKWADVEHFSRMKRSKLLVLKLR